MAEYLFPGRRDNAVHDITYEQIRQLYRDNMREAREDARVTASSYRGENYYDGVNDQMAFYREELYRDPKTAGMRIYYPHGIVIQQSQRRNYYRGENKLYRESVPSLHRALCRYESQKEKELYRMVADMRVAEFSALLRRFEHVRGWKHSDVLYEPLAQHYGLETGWLDITSDFNVALFFATCYWDRTQKRWLPLTNEQTQIGEDRRYGMIYHMPSYRMTSRWSMELRKFTPSSSEVIGHTEDGREIYRVYDYPPYRGDVDNVAYPLGFQPFMRCSMQSGYGIYMRKPYPLQRDEGFEKLRFRHSERLSRDVFEAMKGGERIYPHEGLREAEFVIDEISSATTFSEEAFQYALYRSHYYRLEDRERCLEDLRAFRVNGRPVEIAGESHPWRLSAGRRKRIDEAYRDFSVERQYGIQVLDRKTIPAPRGMFEPWMMPEGPDEPGVTDFRVRGPVDCGSIVERDALRILHTVMMAQMSDF